jgi:predicted O-linked N-acetylglucosamine transferase (SPINDLY family)
MAIAADSGCSPAKPAIGMDRIMIHTHPQNRLRTFNQGHTTAQYDSEPVSPRGFQNTIHYFCPDVDIRSAGIRRLYRHVGILDTAGFKSCILHQKIGFRCSDLPKVPIRYLEQEPFKPNDIIVIPEGCPTIMRALKDHPVRRFVIALNGDYIYRDLKPGTDWRTFNIERVISVSKPIAEMVSWSMGLPTHLLASSIDHQLYYPDQAGKQPHVVYIARKGAHAPYLKRLLAARNQYFTKYFKWISLNGLDQKRYAQQVRRAAIFLNLSMAEGYPTSCLEAMAAGTLVAGYISMGDKTFLCGKGPRQNCLLAPMGDYSALAVALEPFLTAWENGPMEQWNTLLSNGLKTASGLTQASENQSLIDFWRSICSNPPPTATGGKAWINDMTSVNETTLESPAQLSAAFDGIEKEMPAGGLFALARWFDEVHYTEQALHYYHKALQADPGLAEAHHNMGVIYTELQNREKAVFHFEKAIALNPGIADSYSALGLFWLGENRFEQSLVLMEQAVAIKPHFAEGHFNMGLILHQMGEHRRSVTCFQKASACNPSYAPARWLHKLCLPMTYHSHEEVNQLRRRFSDNLDELIDSVHLETPAQIEYAMQGIGSMTHFYLHYQGHNDIELQKKYGNWIHNIISARYPQWRLPPSTPPPRPGEKIRVGYISAFMYHHTVGTFLAGWLENHNSDTFDIHCYHLGQKTDALTDHLRKHSHRFHHLAGNIEAAATQIASDGLHILVYNEVGMHIETMLLAALRLAPVQCAWWGHPVTTGLPTMDYFLSSNLMEPDNAGRYYSETLIRLPNLSLCYHPPKLPKNPLPRKALGIPPDRFIFLSSQSIYKYLPQHDDIYPLIAQKAPHAFFVFISHQSPLVTQRFSNRLREAFNRRNLDADRFCFFSDRLNPEQFLSLNMAADVLLDTLEWSGGKTTLEAISTGLPVVTCPGRFMRGRHAFAMLTMMGITDTIATDITAYCAIAVRLATDSGYFNAVKARFAQQRHKLYNDKVFMAELEKQYGCIARQPSNTASVGKQNPEHWFHSGNAHLRQKNTRKAISAYRKALSLKPEWDAAHYNLAVALHMADRMESAIDHARQAISINADYTNAYPLLFRLAQHVCDWPLAETISKRLDEITRSELADGIKTTEPPLTNLRRSSDVQTNLAVARSWSRHQIQLVRQQSPQPAFEHRKTACRRIRVGYLSADFKDHAVAFQVRGLLDKHDRNQFEIYGYACNPDDGSPYRRKLIDACDRFRDVHGRTNVSIAEQIHKDGVHILVDMSGHSKNNRLGICALRPAPLQVSYLGFLSTTGADFIDYVLADEIVIPEDHMNFYTEKIAYLPHCYQANDDCMPIAPQKQDRPQWGLPDNGFVYCSFNQPYKIDAGLFQSWMRILQKVDHGVLWLVERSGEAIENLRRAAVQAKVDPARLIFTGFVPMDQNLARLRLADLVLDTVIYNGGATTSNALWAGVPVLSTLGGHWVSRMSASALHCTGLSELIAADLAQYEQIAVDLASNPERLQAIKQDLQRHRSTSALFNTALFTRHVEKAYGSMWQRHLCGLPPESFHVEP